MKKIFEYSVKNGYNGGFFLFIYLFFFLIRGIACILADAFEFSFIK